MLEDSGPCSILSMLLLIGQSHPSVILTAMLGWHGPNGCTPDACFLVETKPIPQDGIFLTSTMVYRWKTRGSISIIMVDGR